MGIRGCIRAVTPGVPPHMNQELNPRILRQSLEVFMERFLHEQKASLAKQPVSAALYEDLVEYLKRPSKRVRSLLFLSACRMFDSKLDPRSHELLSIAASLEFLHGFILIHDDLIDRSETRRGKPSLHRVIEKRVSTLADRQRMGANLALVMGDILFALSQKCLFQSGSEKAVALTSRLMDYVWSTGFGEAADIVYGTRDISKVSLGEIEEMYLNKTTLYTIECPLVLAALRVGLADEQLKELAAISAPAGFAFQIENDLSEFERFEVSDSEIPADLLEGKKTVLVKTVYSLLDEKDRGLLQLCLNGSGPSEATVSKLRELITKSGAVSRLRGFVADLMEQTADRVRHSSFADPIKGELLELLGFISTSKKKSTYASAA